MGPDTELKSLLRALGSIRRNGRNVGDFQVIGHKLRDLAPLVVLLVQLSSFPAPWGTHAASFVPLVVMLGDTLVLVKFVRFPNHFPDNRQVEHFRSLVLLGLPTGKKGI